jgi:hypothetical protein
MHAGRLGSRLDGGRHAQRASLGTGRAWLPRGAAPGPGPLGWHDEVPHPPPPPRTCSLYSTVGFCWLVPALLTSTCSSLSNTLLTCGGAMGRDGCGGHACPWSPSAAAAVRRLPARRVRRAPPPTSDSSARACALSRTSASWPYTCMVRRAAGGAARRLLLRPPPGARGAAAGWCLFASGRHCQRGLAWKPFCVSSARAATTSSPLRAQMNTCEGRRGRGARGGRWVGVGTGACSGGRRGARTPHTCAPRPHSSSTTARPMPLVPPVTRHFLPRRCSLRARTAVGDGVARGRRRRHCAVIARAAPPHLVARPWLPCAMACACV